VARYSAGGLLATWNHFLPLEYAHEVMLLWVGWTLITQKSPAQTHCGIHSDQVFNNCKGCHVSVITLTLSTDYTHQLFPVDLM